MLGQILCGLYVTYCLVFCSAIIYSECNERCKKRHINNHNLILEYEEFNMRQTSPKIQMINQSDFNRLHREYD